MYNDSQKKMEKALQLIKEEGLSFRDAAGQCAIPKSTIYDHFAGNVKGYKRGPATVLTEAEENVLANWAVEMVKIGYGRTRQQITEMVKAILDKDGRPNPFSDNRPGKDWWYGFLRRHPNLTMRSPEQLQVSRASACSKQRLDKWYKDFDDFLKEHDVKNPQQIWNADESGFSLCPKSGRVLALVGTKDVYQVTGNSKEQITTLCAISATGSVVPPMHVFPGKRFKIDPMINCVPNAFFGKSDKGWMTAELFYQWLSKHFIHHATIRPLVLLIDGHTSHIDISTAKLYRDNQILLYCLPPHSSHITQPLDVGFYGPLKTNWKKAVSSFTLANVGQSVTKYQFAAIFKDAWESTVKMSTIVNSFRFAGIWPVNPDAVRESKMAPAAVYQVCQEDSACKQGTNSVKKESTELIMNTIETSLSSETKRKFEARYQEGYDLTHDELYNVWSKLKALTLHDDVQEDLGHNDSEDDPFDLGRPGGQGQISEAFKESLVIPKSIVGTKKKTRGPSTMPPHISGDEVIQLMEEKLEKKKCDEDLKKKCREEKEEKRRVKEAEKKRREYKVKKKCKKDQEAAKIIECPVCYRGDDEEGNWICCDLCDTWYHTECVDILQSEHFLLKEDDWYCHKCIDN